MIKDELKKVPLLDGLERGPWPSFVSNTATRAVCISEKIKPEEEKDK